MTKGIDLLFNELAKTECPACKGLTDTERIDGEDYICIYTNAQEKCQQCWRKALEKDYD